MMPLREQVDRELRNRVDQLRAEHHADAHKDYGPFDCRDVEQDACYHHEQRYRQLYAHVALSSEAVRDALACVDEALKEGAQGCHLAWPTCRLPLPARHD